MGVIAKITKNADEKHSDIFIARTQMSADERDRLFPRLPQDVNGRISSAGVVLFVKGLENRPADFPEVACRKGFYRCAANAPIVVSKQDCQGVQNRG